mgnify:CR=1 FL=1
MKEVILLKYGEIVLKGLNRGYFDKLLLRRVKAVLNSFGGEYDTHYSQSTLVIRPRNDDCDVRGLADMLKKVFGIAAVCVGIECEKNMDAVRRAVKDNCRRLIGNAKTFKCIAKRSDKHFELTSPQICAVCGGDILETLPYLRVDVEHPEVAVTIEIRDDAAFVHGGGEKAVGGMPVGSNGRAMLLLSGGIDSPVSTWMITRRGVRCIPVHFFSFPYTSEAAKEKVVELARLLTPWCGQMCLEVVPFTHIQEEIRAKCPEEYFTLVMRRFMMRIAERIAERGGCKAIVTGENLGQVASQTMEAMACTQAVTSLPVLQPLIGMDKEDIIRISRKIGTFETSILPYEDCCTVFTPRHPKTKPKVEDVAAAEAALDVEGLVAEALEGIERIWIDIEG